MGINISDLRCTDFRECTCQEVNPSGAAFADTIFTEKLISKRSSLIEKKCCHPILFLKRIGLKFKDFFYFISLKGEALFIALENLSFLT